MADDGDGGGDGGGDGDAKVYAHSYPNGFGGREAPSLPATPSTPFVRLVSPCCDAAW